MHSKMMRAGLTAVLIGFAATGVMAQTFDLGAINSFSGSGAAGSQQFNDAEGNFILTLDNRDLSGQLGTGSDRVTVTRVSDGEVVIDGNVPDGGASAFVLQQLPGLLGVGGLQVGPVAGTGLLINRLFRNNILQQVGPSDDQVQAVTLGSLSVEAFYDMFEIGNQEGEILGLNSSIAFGDEVTGILTIPIHMVMRDDLDDLYTTGIDAALVIPLGTDYVKIGGHGFYLMQTGEDDPFEDDTTQDFIGGGGFISTMLPLSDQIALSLAVLGEYTEPEDQDGIFEVVPGANLGIRLNDQVALNVYGAYYYNTDAEDFEDEEYIDIGGELKLVMGDSWLVNAGVRTIQDADELDSVQVFLGSQWGGTRGQ